MDSDDNDPNFANPNEFCRNDRVAAIRAETGMVPEVPQKRSPGGRKRCDTWHGKSPRSPDSTHVLEPSIAEGLNTKRKFARLAIYQHKTYFFFYSEFNEISMTPRYLSLELNESTAK